MHLTPINSPILPGSTLLPSVHQILFHVYADLAVFLLHLVFIHVLASNSFILSSPSQPTVVFSKGTGSKLHLVHVPAICVYKPCLSFLLGFSLSSEPIALPSSSELFFSLFCTFNTRHGHIVPRAISDHCKFLETECDGPDYQQYGIFRVLCVNVWECDDHAVQWTTNSVGLSVFFA